MTSISGPAGGSYGYDADGNMVNRSGTAIVWNSDNLPVSITQSASNSSSFAYAPDKHRYYQSAVINSVTETTVYAGAFEAVTTGGVTTYRYHLSADSREVVEVNLSNSGSTVTETVSYVLSDHLGSVDVVQSVNQATSAVTTTDMSFSAWGGRREPATWLPPVGSTETQADHAADRYGFTHQEMLDNVGIIHMNGRIYDPNLGRFLSVDPVFEFPTNTQSLNPYSYVLNNPLSMTDPTGYVAACGTGKANCPDSESGSVTVKTTAHELGSHIATHGMTTISLTKEANGNTVMSASGNGFGLGETAEVSVRASGGGNGAQMQQGTGDSLRNSSATPTGQVTATQEASVTKGNANDATNADTFKSKPSAANANNPIINKNKVAEYMDEHARNASLGRCAAFCRRGLEAGGLNTSGHPIDAKDYGLFLIRHGASVVPEKNYVPEKGDIVVFNGNKSHPYGHIAIYDGKQWVSDFKQRHMSPYRSDTPPSKIYRFPDQN